MRTGFDGQDCAAAAVHKPTSSTMSRLFSIFIRAGLSNEPEPRILAADVHAVPHLKRRPHLAAREPGAALLARSRPRSLPRRRRRAGERRAALLRFPLGSRGRRGKGRARGRCRSDASTPLCRPRAMAARAAALLHLSCRIRGLGGRRGGVARVLPRASSAAHGEAAGDPRARDLYAAPMALPAAFEGGAASAAEQGRLRWHRIARGGARFAGAPRDARRLRALSALPWPGHASRYDDGSCAALNAAASAVGVVATTGIDRKSVV